MGLVTARFRFAPAPAAWYGYAVLCDRVIRNLGDMPPPPGAVAVGLTWQECRVRALQKLLADGRKLRILLPPGVTLRHGDVLHEAAGELIYIEAIPAELLRIAASAVDLVRVIYAFGNLHLPIQIDAGQLLTPADGPAMAVLRELGLIATPERRRFDPLPLPNGLTFRLSTDFTVSRR